MLDTTAILNRLETLVQFNTIEELKPRIKDLINEIASVTIYEDGDPPDEYRCDVCHKIHNTTRSYPLWEGAKLCEGCAELTMTDDFQRGEMETDARGTPTPLPNDEDCQCDDCISKRAGTFEEDQEREHRDRYGEDEPVVTLEEALEIGNITDPNGRWDMDNPDKVVPLREAAKKLVLSQGGRAEADIREREIPHRHASYCADHLWREALAELVELTGVDRSIFHQMSYGIRDHMEHMVKACWLK